MTIYKAASGLQSGGPLNTTTDDDAIKSMQSLEQSLTRLAEELRKRKESDDQ